MGIYEYLYSLSSLLQETCTMDVTRILLVVISTRLAKMISEETTPQKNVLLSVRLEVSYIFVAFFYCQHNNHLLIEVLLLSYSMENACIKSISPLSYKKNHTLSRTCFRYAHCLGDFRYLLYP